MKEQLLQVAQVPLFFALPTWSRDENIRWLVSPLAWCRIERLLATIQT